jgi:glucose/arabinose dehydrogenase
MESPYYVWKNSPGVSGMAFYVGHPTARWNNSLFLGALADHDLIRLSLKGDRIVGEERLLKDLGARIRDVRVSDDGDIYVLTDEDNGRLLKLTSPVVGQ